MYYGKRVGSSSHLPAAGDEAAKFLEQRLSLVKDDAERRTTATQYVDHTNEFAGWSGPAERQRC